MLGKEENPGITLRTVVELYNRIDQVKINFHPKCLVELLSLSILF